MKPYFILLLFLPTFSFLQDCLLEPTNNTNTRALYSIGDTLSIEDQNIIYPVCNGDQEYQINEDFSLSDLNGNMNDNQFKVTIISMNATW